MHFWDPRHWKNLFRSSVMLFILGAYMILGLREGEM
ncbi:unnamed protein product [Linum tenue]|uniref:Uncharacterized protein n=1 Tax=Linum tenue TaxID=586396 RepID=A0AAV0L4B9_9ROSI|nr:unnamed protein product [Linum tenue]